MREIIDEFTKHLERLRTPKGYTSESIGRLGFFLENSGESIIDALELITVHEMEVCVLKDNFKHERDTLQATIEKHEKKIAKLQNEIGNLKLAAKKTSPFAAEDTAVNESLNLVYRVRWLESERGWGQKTDYTYYATLAGAEAAIREVDGALQAGSAPDWYMQSDSKPEPVHKSTVPKGRMIQP